MQSKHESVFIFFIFVFILVVPFWILGAVAPVELLPGLPISAFGVLAPVLAACILIYRNDRLSGVLQLLGRSFDFKRIQNRAWYLAIIFINPVRAVLAYEIMRASGVLIPQPTLTWNAIPLFLFFFIGALAEEIGWTGYAMEPLLKRWGSAIAGILLGFIWMVYHFVPLLQVHRSVEWIAWWSLGTIALRVVMAWLYIHTGKSVFAAAIFHAMSNLCWQLFPVNGSYYDPRIFGLLIMALAIFVVLMEQILPKRTLQTA